jgi:nuclease HARBI1
MNHALGLFQGFFYGSCEVIQLRERYTIHFETGLLLCLFQLAYPCRVTPTMTYGFKMNHTKVCIALKYFFKISFTRYHSCIWLILIFGPIGFPTMQSWLKIKQKDLLVMFFCFMDGTLQKTCRPKHNQKVCYSGHKRHHGLKYQSLYTPDGMYMDVYGPITGSRHDPFLLSDSNLLRDLAVLYSNHEFSIYSDPAYPQSGWLFGGFHNPAPGTDDALFNKEMSSVREAVEWGFASLI